MGLFPEQAPRPHALLAVAYKRFADTVPKVIDAKFVRGLDSALDDALRGLEKDQSVCRQWLMEPAATIRKREELTGRKSRLEAASTYLSAFASPAS